MALRSTVKVLRSAVREPTTPPKSTSEHRSITAPAATASNPKHLFAAPPDPQAPVSTQHAHRNRASDNIKPPPAPVRYTLHHGPGRPARRRCNPTNPQERSTLRWLAIDYGTRRIGLACCDPDEQLASPAGVLAATGDPRTDARRVLDWARNHEINALVVGLPINMNGTVGPQARTTFAFFEALKDLGTLPVETFDERLTSFQADQWLTQRGASRRQRKKLRDTLAALAILQSFLASRRDRP